LRDDASFLELTKVQAKVEQGKKILGVLSYNMKNIFELRGLEEASRREGE
jgi:hypothetical protein